MVAKLVLSLAAGLLTVGVTVWWRDFPMRLALLSGISVGLLSYSAMQASGRLLKMYRR
ncbi:MAG: hypothetical protein VYE73_05725 [Acidobacteriota bacterium]|nr:hypothetical protein [Acidobacteriota bacterium]